MSFVEDSALLWVALYQHEQPRYFKLIAYSVPELEIKAEILHANKIARVTHHTGRGLIACCGSKSITFYNSDTGEKLPIFESFNNSVVAGTFTPDGNFFLATGYFGETWELNLADATIAMGPNLGEFLYQVEYGRSGEVFMVTHGSQEGCWLSIGIGSRTNFETRTGSLQSVGGGFGTCLSPDEKYLAVTDIGVVLYELPWLDEARVIASQNGSNSLDGVDEDEQYSWSGRGWMNPVFSADSRMLAAISPDRHIFVWDVSTGELIGKMLGQEGRYKQLRFSPDGKYLVTVRGGSELVLYEIRTNTAQAVE